jgi:hypothetical protein
MAVMPTAVTMVVPVAFALVGFESMAVVITVVACALVVRVGSIGA